MPTWLTGYYDLVPWEERQRNAMKARRTDRRRRRRANRSNR